MYFNNLDEQQFKKFSWISLNYPKQSDNPQVADWIKNKCFMAISSNASKISSTHNALKYPPLHLKG